MFCIYLRTNSDFCPIQHKWLVFITEMKSVYCAVRAGSLNKAVCASSLNGYLLSKRLFERLVSWRAITVICGWSFYFLCSMVSVRNVTSFCNGRLFMVVSIIFININPLNAELNPICHLLALLGAHHILHVSRIRVNPYSSNTDKDTVTTLLFSVLNRYPKELLFLSSAGFGRLSFW